MNKIVKSKMNAYANLFHNFFRPLSIASPSKNAQVNYVPCIFWSQYPNRRNASGFIIWVAGVMVNVFLVDIILIWREMVGISFFFVGGLGGIMLCYECGDT